MNWQDYVIAAIQLSLSFALLPALLGTIKPDRLTCALTGSLVLAFIVPFASLGLWFGVATSALCGSFWVILLVQRRA